MALLQVYDDNDIRMRFTAKRRKADYNLPLKNPEELIDGFAGFYTKGIKFNRVLFHTHGNSGYILFGKTYIDAEWWKSRNLSPYVLPHSRIYFSGCNVAEGEEGWRFLEAAASCFLLGKAGQVFGQTSLGFMSPFSGHVLHFWGNVRTIFVNGEGRIIERFEQ